MDGKGHISELLPALLLVRRRGPDRRIEGDVILFIAGRARLDVTSPLSLRAGPRTAPAVPAGQLV